MIRAIFFWTAALLYMLAVFMVSVSPNPPKLPEVLAMDKAAHFGVYAVMGLLWALALDSGPRGWGLKPFSRAALAVLAAALYGAFIEVCQGYVPGRSADALDALVNAAGALSSVYVYRRVMRRLRGASL